MKFNLDNFEKHLIITQEIHGKLQILDVGA